MEAVEEQFKKDMISAAKPAGPTGQARTRAEVDCLSLQTTEMSNTSTQGSPYGGSQIRDTSIWRHNPCPLGVPAVGSNQHGYIAVAF